MRPAGADRGVANRLPATAPSTLAHRTPTTRRSSRSPVWKSALSPERSTTSRSATPLHNERGHQRPRLVLRRARTHPLRRDRSRQCAGGGTRPQPGAGQEPPELARGFSGAPRGLDIRCRHRRAARVARGPRRQGANYRQVVTRRAVSIAQNARLDRLLDGFADLLAALQTWERRSNLVVVTTTPTSSPSGFGFAHDALRDLQDLAQSADESAAVTARDALRLLHRLVRPAQ